MVDIVKLVHRTNEYTYNFKDFWTINTFGRGIYNSKTILKEADEDQSSLVVEIMNFKKKKKTSKSRERRREKKIIFLKTYMHLSRVEKQSLMLLKAKYFQYKLKVQVLRQGFRPFFRFLQTIDL